MTRSGGDKPGKPSPKTDEHVRAFALFCALFRICEAACIVPHHAVRCCCGGLKQRRSLTRRCGGHEEGWAAANPVNPQKDRWALHAAKEASRSSFARGHTSSFFGPQGPAGFKSIAFPKAYVVGARGIHVAL